MTLPSVLHRAGQPRADLPGAGGNHALFSLAMVVIVVAALYFGRDIFVPLALAMLLSFALAPIVRWLRRIGLPNIPSVLGSVAVAFLVILTLGGVLAWQLADLAERLPTYRLNIESKIETLKESPPGGSLFERATDMLRDLGRKIEEDDQQAARQTTPDGSPEEQQPLPVEIHEPPPSSMQIVTSILGPLVSPLATAGIVIVFVIFMLLKRDDLRDRVIRLAGARDIPRTTQALDDAARRVGRYLLMQLLVNTFYAVPIGIGLWLIGLPNPLLWAMLCGTLRFVPYIGPIIAAFFPLALAIAVDPGWTMLVLTGALIVVVELAINNIVEPWLYGASTGLSPIAIIASAVFWTWLWGPVGLLLSTPLTVCLVVLGRHVPQFAFLDVLLGDTPALDPPELLYRRLLAGDPNEATERAEEYLREHSIWEFYGEVAIPALALAEEDRAATNLSEEQRLRVADSATVLLDNLSEWEDVTPMGEGEEEPAVAEPVSLAGMKFLSAGARGNLDDAAAAMLAQLLEQRGADVKRVAHESLQTAALREIDLDAPQLVFLSYLNADSFAHARFLVRRLRRRLPGATFVIGFWNLDPAEADRRDPRDATGADHVAMSLKEAVALAASVGDAPLAEAPATLALQR